MEMMIVGSLINSTACLFHSVRLLPFGAYGEDFEKAGEIDVHGIWLLHSHPCIKPPNNHPRLGEKFY